MTAVILGFLLLIALLSFKYPYLSLILFLTTGFVKTTLIVNIGLFRVVDYTLICAFILAFAMFYSFIKGGGKFKGLFSGGVLLYILLSVLLFMGCAYTSSPKWGLQKSLSFVTFSFVTFLAPILFSQKSKDIKLMIILLFLSGFLVAIGTIVAPHAAVIRGTAETRGAFLEAAALTSSSFIAMSFMIAYCVILFRQSKIIARLICLCLLFPMLYAIIISGSRGPFVGLGICLTAIMFLAYRRIPKIAFIIVPVIAIMGGAVMMIKLPEEQTDRIAKIFRGGYFLRQEADSRLQLFNFALKEGARSPIIGHGTGSFAVDYAGLDERAYPHNIFLEFFYENGLIGDAVFLIFLIFIFYYWVRCRRMANSYSSEEMQWIVDAIGILMLFAFIQANKSSSITGQRPLFFICGLIIATYRVLFEATEITWIEESSDLLENELDEIAY